MRNYTAEQWREIRAKGKPAFLFRSGFFGRGLPFGILVAVVIEVMRGGVFPDALSETAFLLRVALAVAVFTLSGSLGAQANWSVHERRHGYAEGSAAKPGS